MTWVLVLLLLYLAVLLIAGYASVYPYRTPVFFSPGAMGVPQEAVTFVNEEGITLSGWWCNPERPKAIVILCHGYMMNKSELSPLAGRLVKEDLACLVFDFRSHGKSGRGRCGAGHHEVGDVQAAVQFAKSKHPELPVILIGSSMGAVASALAVAKHANLAQAIILDSAYSRLVDATLGWWEFVGGKVLRVLLAPTVITAMPFAKMNPFRVDVAQAIRSTGTVPILILHGDADKLAPPSQAVRNQAAAPDRTQLVWLKGCDHSEGRWVHSELYERTILEFIRAQNLI